MTERTPAGVGVCEVIITGPGQGWAATLTRALVDERLAACGHIINEIRSIYRWEGSVHDKAEVRVSLHTRTGLVAAITDRARADHPYAVPCVIAVPIAGGSPAYINWILAETDAG